MSCSTNGASLPTGQRHDPPDPENSVNPEILRQSPLFAGLRLEDLDWLSSQSEIVAVRAGDLLMKQGDAGDSAYLILDGEFEVLLRSGEQEVPIAVRGSGDVIGEMALLDKSPRSASVRALQDGHLLRISQPVFERLLTSSPDVVLTVLSTVMGRLRNTESTLRHQEKMASLGTLSAGLAHELNNQATAAQRSSAHLRQALMDWQTLAEPLFQQAALTNQADWLHSLNAESYRRSTTTRDTNPLERIDRADRIQSWLEDRNISEAWELAPTLASSGWEPEPLEEIHRNLQAAELGCSLEDIIRYVVASSSLYTLVDEVHQSTERISQIVNAVKSYAYLDQAPIQEVDIHQGLENTLVILQHKLKGGVVIHREYAANLPCIEAFGSELNQVWTNLIDNAVDAMQGRGELTLRTYPRDENVIVEIADTGPGIPPDIQKRIFDPFFTTKPPGSGSGLGLHTSYNIVVHRHKGLIQVSSQPGETCFQVTLPIRMRKSTP